MYLYTVPISKFMGKPGHSLSELGTTVYFLITLPNLKYDIVLIKVVCGTLFKMRLDVWWHLYSFFMI